MFAAATQMSDVTAVPRFHLTAVHKKLCELVQCIDGARLWTRRRWQGFLGFFDEDLPRAGNGVSTVAAREMQAVMRVWLFSRMCTARVLGLIRWKVKYGAGYGEVRPRRDAEKKQHKMECSHHHDGNDRAGLRIP